MHTTRLIESATLDGEPFGLSPGTEAGFPAYSAYVDIGPGATTELAVRFVPADGAPTGELVVQPQPLTTPEQWTISLDGDDRCDGASPWRRCARSS